MNASYLSVGSSAAATATERVGDDLPNRGPYLYQRDVHTVPGDGEQLELSEHAEGLGHAAAGHVDGDGASRDPVVRPERVGHLDARVLPQQLAELGVEAQQRRGRGGREEEHVVVGRGGRGGGERGERGERERERVEAGRERPERGPQAEQGVPAGAGPGRRERGGGEVEQREVRAGGGVDEAGAKLPPRQGVPRLEHLVLERRVEVELHRVVVPDRRGGGRRRRRSGGSAGRARGSRRGDRGGRGGAAAAAAGPGGGGRGALRHRDWD